VAEQKEPESEAVVETIPSPESEPLEEVKEVEPIAESAPADEPVSQLSHCIFICGVDISLFMNLFLKGNVNDEYED
jgi:hypothetical protein